VEAPEPAKPSLIEDELDARLQQLVTSASGVGSTRGEVSDAGDLFGISVGLPGQSVIRDIGDARIAQLPEATSEQEGKV
jgi:hypothetical protein